MGHFWNTLLLITFALGVTSCQEVDFYKKPELISSDFKDRYYPKDEESTFDIGDTTDQVDQPTDSTQGDDSTVDSQPSTPVVVINDPSADDGNDPGDTTADNPGDGSGDTTVDNPGDGSGDTTVDNPADGSGDTTVDNPADGSGDTTVDNPVDETPVDQGPVLETISESFTQNIAQKSKVDILWVVDNSGSMGDEQDSLAYNFDVFIHEFLKQNVDFKMGITTTDARPGYIGKDENNSIHHLTSEMAQKNERKFIQDFKRLIKVGTHGSGTEMGLKTMESFLTTTAVEKDFLREDAYLVVVMISDEKEQSSLSSDHYVQFLKSLKGHDGWVKVNSIVTQTPIYRWETVGTKYMEVSEQTNGKIIDIKADFHTALQDMGTAIVNLTKSFALGQKPYSTETISVLVDGVVNTEWSYNSETNAIEFNDGSAPAAGSSIEASFQIEK